MRISVIALILVFSGVAQASVCTGWVNVKPTAAFASRGPEAKNLSIRIPQDVNESATVTVEGQPLVYSRVLTDRTTIEIKRVEPKETTTIKMVEKRDGSVDLSGEVVGTFGKIYDLSAVLSCKR